ASAEAKRAQGGDLTRTLRDSGVHGIERAKDGPNAHDHGHNPAQNINQLGQYPGLFVVILDLPADVYGQSWVRGYRVLELLQSIDGGEVHCQGLKNVFRAMIDLVEHSGITPDFGVEGGAAGVKDTNYFPRAPAEYDGVANLEAGIRATHVPAHYQLSQTWMEERAL